LNEIPSSQGRRNVDFNDTQLTQYSNNYCYSNQPLWITNEYTCNVDLICGSKVKILIIFLLPES
ncbi:16596_t:CDS:1, partial [Entrophospora sp. SA101]